MDVRVGFFVLFVGLLGAVSALVVLPLLQYVMGAALLAFVLFPAHKRVVRTRFEVGGHSVGIGAKLSAGILTAVAVVGAIVPILFITVVIFQTVRSFSGEFQSSELTPTVEALAGEFGMTDETIKHIESQLLAEFEQLFENGMQYLAEELIGLINTSIRVGVGLLIFVFLLYYFLVDGERFIGWVSGVAPLNESVRTQLFEEIHVVTWAVMKSHVFVAVIEGVLGGIGLYLLGVPNAAFWTVVMIVVSFLPAIGIWLVWGPAVVFLAIAGNTTQAGLLLMYGVTVLSVVDNYVRAILVDRQSGVHPALVLVGVIGGIYLFGILGLFLGPVLLAAFKAGIQVFGDVYDPKRGTMGPVEENNS